jgi:hypothetical protein
MPYGSFCKGKVARCEPHARTEYRLLGLTRRSDADLLASRASGSRLVTALGRFGSPGRAHVFWRSSLTRNSPPLSRPTLSVIWGRRPTRHRYLQLICTDQRAGNSAGRDAACHAACPGVCTGDLLPAAVGLLGSASPAGVRIGVLTSAPGSPPAPPRPASPRGASADKHGTRATPSSPVTSARESHSSRTRRGRSREPVGLVVTLGMGLRGLWLGGGAR